MTFLNPLILFGLAAAAIPLIIHLFNFRRPKRVNFSSLAFLHELKKSTMQRVRIKQWLLLALRTLAIVCLVLAFSRPTLRGSLVGKLGGRGRTSTALVLDNSTSMILRDGSGSYLDQAKTIVSGLLEDFQSGDEIMLIPSPSLPSTTVPHQNAQSASEALAAIQLEDGNAKLTDAIRLAASRLAERANINLDLFVVSDFQSSTLSDTSALDVGEDIRIVLLPVGTDGRPNLSVSDVRVVSQIITEGQPVQFEAQFTNYGSEEVRGLVASLFVEGERIAQASVDIQARSTATARFVASPRQSGWLAGYVEIDDNQYLFDNKRHFTLHVPEERHILIVTGTGARDEYVRLSLSNELTGGSMRFSTDEIPETALAGTSLGGYDAVILVGVRDLSSGERAALAEYVKGGGGLLIFSGDDLVLGDYNDLLADLGAGTITGIAEGSSETEMVGTFEAVDTDHPLFEGMFEPDPNGRTPQLEQPVIFKTLVYQPGRGTEQTVISLTSGHPFLQEIRSGQGSLLLYSIEAGAVWSDFPVRGLFIPMLYRSLYYLSATGSVSGDEMIAGSSLQLRLAGKQDGASITVVDETGRDFIPEQRRVLGGVVINLAGTFFLPGTFEIIASGKTIRRFVVHPSPDESDLALADPAGVAEHLSLLSGTEVSVMRLSLTGSTALGDQLRAARTGVELWNVFLGLALVFLVLEMIVSKHFRPEAAA